MCVKRTNPQTHTRAHTHTDSLTHHTRTVLSSGGESVPQGSHQEKEGEKAPPLPIGSGPTKYGIFCEPPTEVKVAWSERRFEDEGTATRHAYEENYSRVVEADTNGTVAESDFTMLPKVAMRGKSEKLVCDYVDDEPALLEAPFAARRGPLLWPDEWYRNSTIQLVSDWH